MEYRIFDLIDKTLFENKWKNEKKHFEYRIDIYFLLFDENYGLKLRNKKRLELKKRQNHFENGQEYWEKTLKSHEKVSIDDLQSIIQILEHSNENQLKEKLISTEPMILCYLHKYRQQKSVGYDLLYELTGFQLQFIRANDRTQIGNDLFFETLCIQSIDSKLIDMNRIENIERDFSNEKCEPMGYPEFLIRQYQKFIN